ncbi:MAG: hypothetical protein RB294_03785 [Bacteroidales bacterium]|jgi:hypothetical protein|nr:hypothetical protein [Bacteroidales bacterium]
MKHFRFRSFVALAFLLWSGLFKANAQTQSFLLPVPGATTSTGPCTMINFSDNANPVVTELPSNTFTLSGQPGDPHSEYDLHAQSFDSQNGEYRFDEVYLGQHPMYAQNIVHDADGNLLFFIVDNNIYNRYGEAMIDV